MGLLEMFHNISYANRAFAGGNCSGLQVTGPTLQLSSIAVIQSPSIDFNREPKGARSRSHTLSCAPMTGAWAATFFPSSIWSCRRSYARAQRCRQSSQKFAATAPLDRHVAKLRTIKDNDESFVATHEMLRELMNDNKHIAASMHECHELAEKHEDVATASPLENFIDGTERRTWFLFEASRAAAQGTRNVDLRTSADGFGRGSSRGLIGVALSPCEIPS